MFFAAPLVAQESDSNPFKSPSSSNPFAPSSSQAANAPKSKPVVDSGEASDNEQVKDFAAKITQLQEEYARMVARERELLNTISRLSDLAETGRLLRTNDGDANAALEQKINQLQAKARTLAMEIQHVTEQNKLLKSAINQSQASEAKAKEAAEKAAHHRNEMHQALFETLIESNDSAQQELALVHLFKCVDKYPQDEEFPINIYKPNLLRRISLLADSESEKVRGLAAKCLFEFTTETAVEMGIQFAPTWHPLEYFRSSVDTLRIHQSLKHRCAMHYAEVPLVEVIEDLQRHYNMPFRLGPNVDPKTPITYENRNQSLASSLTALLGDRMGYAIVDETIVIMKSSNPGLQVSRTYNVQRLLSDKVDLKKIFAIIQQELGSDAVKLTEVNDHVFVSQTSEPNQHRIQQQLGTLAPQANWYSK